MNYQSKFFSNEIELPAGWTPKEFWWVVEQLEKLESDKLFVFCLEFDILNGKTPRGSVKSKEMIKKIVYEGEKDKVLNTLKRSSGFISKYFSIDYSPIPAGWTPKEFWWVVEQLERHGDKNNLFDLASKLGIKYDEIYRGKVDVGELISVIISEGGSKEKIVESIKRFCDNDQKTRTRIVPENC